MSQHSRTALAADDPLATDHACTVCGESNSTRRHYECDTDRETRKKQGHRASRAGMHASRYTAPPAMRGEWMIDALCRNSPTPDLWFAEDRPTQAIARAVCNECPVREACQAWADRRPEPFGMWGGMTATARARKRERLRRGEG